MEELTRDKLIRFIRKEVFEAVQIANRAAFWNNVKDNAYWVGILDANLRMLQRIGCSVEYTVKKSEDFKIETILNIKIDGVYWYGWAAK